MPALLSEHLRYNLVVSRRAKVREGRLIFRLHAIQRMYERGIAVEDVRLVLASGKTSGRTGYLARIYLSQMG